MAETEAVAEEAEDTGLCCRAKQVANSCHPRHYQRSYRQSFREMADAGKPYAGLSMLMRLMLTTGGPVWDRQVS